MCLNRITKCDDCGKDSDGIMTCYFTDGETTHLCPDCLKKDGSFCMGCGNYCSGMASFDFHHPGYCDTCWDEIDDDWDDDEYDDYDPFEDDDTEEFPNGSLDY